MRSGPMDSMDLAIKEICKRLDEIKADMLAGRFAQAVETTKELDKLSDAVSRIAIQGERLLGGDW